MLSSSIFNRHDPIIIQKILVSELLNKMGCISGMRFENSLNSIIKKAEQVVLDASNLMEEMGKLTPDDILMLLNNDKELILDIIHLMEEKGKQAIFEDVSLLEEIGIQALNKDILNDIQNLRLRLLSQKNRVCLIDTAVKCGYLSIVQGLTEIFISQGFKDDIRIPSKDNADHPYRPTFWLASIVTRYRPQENYVAIEKYLCEKLNIPNVVNINGKNTTREEYILAVDKWKHAHNLRFMVNANNKELTYPCRKPRHRRHEFLNEIEIFDQSKLRKVS